MRIAYINSVAGFGSTGKIVYQLSCIPEVTGKLYYGRKKNTTSANVFKCTHFIGNVHHAIHTYLFDTHGFCNTLETKRLIADLKAFNPDIIHLHNLHGYYLNVDTLFSYLKETGKPVIWTLHDCWSFTGHCAHYDSIGCSKWETECKNCPGLHKYPVTYNGLNVTSHYYKKKSIFNSLHSKLTIVTPSLWLKSQVEKSFLQNNRMAVIPNGIDTSIFHPAESNFIAKHHLEKQFVLLAVASVWDETKGLKDLQQLSKQLHRNEKLIAVGVSKSQMSGFDPVNTICIERTENIQELVAMYSASNLFVNFTYEDTFPTVNLEALACGCPILTYDTGGSTEMVNQQTGLAIGKGRLSEAIHIVHELSSSSIETFSREACVHYAKQFTVQNMQNQYEELYKSVLGEDR